MRDDCPELLKSVARLLGKAFTDSRDDSDTGADSENNDKGQSNASGLQASEFLVDMVPELTSISGAHFLSRIEAPYGFYAIPSAPGAGNSYVSFYPNGDRSCEWMAGRIHYIFEHNGITKLAIKRSTVSTLGSPDPFKAFWADGFQAKLVSVAFSSELELVEIGWLRGHTARWEMNAELAVVLDISKVSRHQAIGAQFYQLHAGLNVKALVYCVARMYNVNKHHKTIHTAPVKRKMSSETQDVQ
jgi:hypothetical protein